MSNPTQSNTNLDHGSSSNGALDDASQAQQGQSGGNDASGLDHGAALSTNSAVYVVALFMNLHASCTVVFHAIRCNT